MQKNKKYFIILLILLIFLPTGVSYSQENYTVKIAGCEYPPYHCKGASGVGTEIIESAFNSIGFKSVVEILPLKRRNHNFLNLTADGHVPGKVHLKDNEAQDTETVVFYYANICLIYYRPNLTKIDLEKLENFKDIKSLNYLKAATIEKSATSKLFEKNGFRVHYSENVPNLLDVLKKNRVNIISLIDITALVSIKEHFNETEFANFGITKPIISVPLGTAFNNKHKKFSELIGNFRKGLDIIKNNGDYIRIFEQYYGKDNIPKDVLSKDMVNYGKDKIDIKKFMGYKRDLCGKITN